MKDIENKQEEIKEEEIPMEPESKLETEVVKKEEIKQEVIPFEEEVIPQAPKEEKEDKKGKKEKPGLWQRLFNTKKIVKTKKVAIIFLRNNGIAEPMEVRSKNGFFNIYGKIYHEDRSCTYTIAKERIPFAIIPEWSMIPYGTKVWHEKPMIEKFSELEDHVIRGIRHAELVKMGGGGADQKINLKTAILIGIFAIIALAVIFGYK